MHFYWFAMLQATHKRPRMVCALSHSYSMPMGGGGGGWVDLGLNSRKIQSPGSCLRLVLPPPQKKTHTHPPVIVLPIVVKIDSDNSVRIELRPDIVAVSIAKLVGALAFTPLSLFLTLLYSKNRSEPQNTKRTNNEMNYKLGL